MTAPMQPELLLVTMRKNDLSKLNGKIDTAIFALKWLMILLVITTAINIIATWSADTFSVARVATTIQGLGASVLWGLRLLLKAKYLEHKWLLIDLGAQERQLKQTSV